MVGAPIGHDAFVRRFAEDRAAEWAPVFQKLVQLTSTQAAWLLLLFCGVPRANHFLRTLPPDQARFAASAHDAQTLECLGRLLGFAPGSDSIAAHGASRNVWVRQTYLPLPGGCGLRDNARARCAAFWASWADCIPVWSRRYPNFAVSFAE